VDAAADPDLPDLFGVGAPADDVSDAGAGAGGTYAARFGASDCCHAIGFLPPFWAATRAAFPNFVSVAFTDFLLGRFPLAGFLAGISWYLI